MKKYFAFLFFIQFGFAQLTLEKIMRSQDWFGYLPSSPSWSDDEKKIYFNWRGPGDKSDSVYVIETPGKPPRKLNLSEKLTTPTRGGNYNSKKILRVYEKHGDIFLLNIEKNKITQITNTVSPESNPQFADEDKKIAFENFGNIFKWNISTGEILQFTNFNSGIAPQQKTETANEKFLKSEEEKLFAIIKKRKENSETAKQIQKNNLKPKDYFLNGETVSNWSISPNGKYSLILLAKNSEQEKKTIVPNYVSTTGFTENLNTRSKVGSPQTTYKLFLFDSEIDSMFFINTDSILHNKKTNLWTNLNSWHSSSEFALLQSYSADNKNRWIYTFNPKKKIIEKILSHQIDSAWIGGSGAYNAGIIPNTKTIWYQSEENGYFHIYTIGSDGKNKKQITNGNFEVYDPIVSKSGENFYFTSNEVHPGEKHFYTININGGTTTKLTKEVGQHECILSPNENYFLDLFSKSNEPPEIYLQKNNSSDAPIKITQTREKEYYNYKWVEPEIINFKSRDKKNIYARLYQPKNKNGAAVIFVHGAGYLQNAHKGWSYYWHEYFFHNFLIEQGFTVLDLDYRASAGYGRDWRTAIYRHMGGHDLNDNIDGAKFLTENFGINAKRIGIYGGSYGGFITLMAMFTAPEIFSAGAALRPVTDWAHYNHGYTSDILNIPQDDTVAFIKSSPIYFADGLKGALLICHGMVDVNVHYQDAVRLAQKLIELKKENWELASYPIEDHAFTEETSWLDEYKRIYKLFKNNLLK